MKVTVILTVIGALGTIPEKLIKGLKDLEISIIKIGQNTEKSPADLRRLALTQTPVKNNQLSLVWKNSKRNNKDRDKRLDLAKELKKIWKWRWQLYQSWLVFLIQSSKDY